jgi:hypothetical protein
MFSEVASVTGQFSLVENIKRLQQNEATEMPRLGSKKQFEVAKGKAPLLDDLRTLSVVFAKSYSIAVIRLVE